MNCKYITEDEIKFGKADRIPQELTLEELAKIEKPCRALMGGNIGCSIREEMSNDLITAKLAEIYDKKYGNIIYREIWIKIIKIRVIQTSL